MSDTTPDGGALLERIAPVQRLIELCADAHLTLDGAYAVGGVVRDALLGIPAGRDVDIAVEGSGTTFAHLLASATGGDVVAEHAFGTATVVAPIGADGGSVRIDVASCRTETYREPGALPSVEVGASIDDDLVRRDVRVNAIAVALAPDADGRHRIVDPHDGVADLHARVLRALHDDSFRDDPTRIFRVARYAGRLGFRVDDTTRELVRAAVDAGALATLSADRVRAELELVLQEPAWESLTLLASWGITDRLEPRLEQAFRPPLLLRTIDDACGDDDELNTRVWPLRLAALARGLGDDVSGWMRWLGFSADATSAVAEHVHVLGIVLGGDTAELVARPNSELYRRLGELTDDSFALAALAAGNDPTLPTRLAEYRRAIRDVRLTVRGDDVVAAGVPAGPAVGMILGDLFLRSLDGELDGEVDERAALAEHARAHQEGTS